MKLHEFQAKRILEKYQVPISKGFMIEDPDQAKEIYQQLQSKVVAVKAQIHAGGRGKGGGVKLARSAEEALQHARAIFGMTLVTPQTGPTGQLVRKLYLEAGADIKKEMYLALLLDRDSSRLMFVAASEGGMDIEELAKTDPEKIIQMKIDPLIGFRSFQARELGFALGLSSEIHSKLFSLCQGMIEAFWKSDASMIEINPLVLTQEKQLLALDAKMTIDDNALFRQKQILEMRDFHEENQLELEASQHGLNYIALEGEIGCMVNGAGLAMATMDVIKLAGSEPANFLDVGGGASEEAVTAAFKIILKDPKVKAILVNIFGGIMRGDYIANGILGAIKATQLKIPLVVRLQGTNSKEGLAILKSSGVAIETAETIDEAAEKVVRAAKKS
jgi:succinyl-CoA synthetase beta subunit